MDPNSLRTGRLLALLSLIGSGLLSILNVWAGWAGNSTSALAAGVEFAGDVFSSAIVLIGMQVAAKPPDAEHPYGHGRFEMLAGLMVGVILSAGGGGICYRSISSLGGVMEAPAAYTVWPLVAALVIKSSLSFSKFRHGRKIGSLSLVADAWNDAVDIISAATALGALGLALSDPGNFRAADHYGGFAVGILVIYSGMHVIYETAVQLVDTMPSEALMGRIRQVALTVPGVRGVEKCFARKTGLQYHVDLHLEVDPEITVRASHDIATEVRIVIKETIDSIADVLVHVEPYEH